MTRTIRIDIACNDPDNGSFAGKTNMIQYRFDGDYIELEADNWGGYAFTDSGSWIRLHRRKFEVIGSKEWFGNWCWNAYGFKRSVGVNLIMMLRASGRWRCTHGPSRWYDWFNAPHETESAGATVAILGDQGGPAA
jgi:hypothetical protein